MQLNYYFFYLGASPKGDRANAFTAIVAISKELATLSRISLARYEKPPAKAGRRFSSQRTDNAATGVLPREFFILSQYLYHFALSYRVSAIKVTSL